MDEARRWHSEHSEHSEEGTWTGWHRLALAVRRLGRMVWVEPLSVELLMRVREPLVLPLPRPPARWSIRCGRYPA